MSRIPKRIGVRRAYESERFRVPRVITSWAGGAARKVELALGAR